MVVWLLIMNNVVGRPFAVGFAQDRRVVRRTAGKFFVPSAASIGCFGRSRGEVQGNLESVYTLLVRRTSNSVAVGQQEQVKM